MRSISAVEILDKELDITYIYQVISLMKKTSNKPIVCALARYDEETPRGTNK